MNVDDQRYGRLLVEMVLQIEAEADAIAVPLRRGPAGEAARCYEETAASKARREEFAARMKVAAGFTQRPAQRPDKHGRRLLRGRA